jgi:hypothetical protein
MKNNKTYYMLPNIHILHTHGNIAIVHKCAIEAHNMFRVAVMHILHLSHYLPSHH